MTGLGAATRGRTRCTSGLDWAADEHAGLASSRRAARVVERFERSPTPPRASSGSLGSPRPAGPSRPACRWPSSGPMADSWTACSRPAIRSWRSRPRPSRPGARPRSARVPRATRVTLKVIADYLRLRFEPSCDRCGRSATRRGRCARSCARGRPRRCPGGRGQPAACDPGRRLARSRRALRRRGQPHQPRLPRALPAPRPRRARLGEGRMGCVPAPSTATAVGAAPPSCSSGCGPHPQAWPTGPSRRPADAVVRSMVRVLRALDSSIKELGPRRSWPIWASTRTPWSSARCHEPVASTPPRCSPSGATVAKPTTDPRRWLPWSGMAPVTRRSGKRLAVGFRWACNKPASARPWPRSPTTAAMPVPGRRRSHSAAIDRGADHPHAVRILARAWIGVIYRCWLDGVAYDPARHGAARRLEAQADGADRGLGLTQRASSHGLLSNRGDGWPGVGPQGHSHDPHRPAQARVDGALGDAQCLGHLFQRHVEMEVQDDDDALIDAQPCEDALQLVAVKDGGEVGGGRRLTEGQGLNCRAPIEGCAWPRRSRRERGCDGTTPRMQPDSAVGGCCAKCRSRPAGSRPRPSIQSRRMLCATRKSRG